MIIHFINAQEEMGVDEQFFILKMMFVIFLGLFIFILFKTNNGEFITQDQK